jgi:hypothetical protein
MGGLVSSVTVSSVVMVSSNNFTEGIGVLRNGVERCDGFQQQLAARRIHHRADGQLVRRVILPRASQTN